MKLPRNAKVFRGQLDVAPVVGVFFLLLIFLLLQNYITFVPGVPVQLPEGVNLSGFRGPAMAVIIDRDGQLFFDNQQLTREQMQKQMAAAAGRSELPLTLLVQADQNVTYGVLMELNLMARESGINDVFHVVKPSP